ncbi:MAG: alpha/beta fold hydrolase [Myxococcales bacterium]|nr:alpha/beta fold hydrolase [Myxococcales bacterium]
MPYRAPFFVRDGHFNTIRAHFHRGQRPDYMRQRIETADGDFFDVDRLSGPPGAPKLIGLHGLEGSSESAYMQRLMIAAHAQGFETAVIHARGCSGQDNRLVSSYHAGFTSDVDAFLRAEKARAPHLPVMAVGFSLGGSQLGNWLGRTADAHHILEAAVLVSPPLRLAPSSDAIGRGNNRHVYQRRFLRSLKAKAVRKAEAWPKHRRRALAAARAESVRKYDHIWTGPMHGYLDAEDYYNRASSAPYIRHIKVPTRVLHAMDDPFVPMDAVPDAAFVGASCAELVRTRHGGHVGFFGRGAVHADSWLEDWILRSLSELG